MPGTPPASAALVDELVTGNHILFHEKVVDAFGHISVRHDKDPSKFLLSRHRAPGLVQPSDILVHDFDGNPEGSEAGARLYGERFIHGEIYRARPDVVAVVHCHAPQLIPFCATRSSLKPLYHMSGFLGRGVPIFEIRETGGMTDMLIRSSALGVALAKSLAAHPMVLMRGHGATMVGNSIQQVVYRSIYAALNAALQMEALRLGEPIYLAREEAEQAEATNDKALDRAWALWKQEAAG
ncbi:MAG TPA: class II aldolase/adducin family protein [Stellaceae bacterium]|nr:class II aldolase/adducin family protein [Stellaceae bacterium]